MRYLPFLMERWQSRYEHRVRYNLSESGVHPFTVGELVELCGADPVEGTHLEYGQSNGSDELRARIAALYPGATEANVLVTAGGAEANFVTAWQLTEPGAAAAVMVPSYLQIHGLVESFGGRALPFRLVEERGWEPDLGALERALVQGSRFVLVTNPNNPTGQVLSADDVARIAALADRHGAWIVADEVFAGAEVDGPTTPTFWGRAERVVVTSSLSKAYGLPGLRVGWVTAPEPLIAELWGRTDYTSIAIATLSDRLARAALEPGARERIFARTRGIVRGNLDVVDGWARGRADVRYRPPRAGAIAFLRYDLPLSSTELAERLRVEKDVLVVPGDHFGMDAYVRIGFGLPRTELGEALDRIGSLLTTLAGGRT